jgi:glycosyltransferase involved in cell wall biosynthesis
MIAKNEEKHIKRCLNSAVGAVDEMIVVDTGSTDYTKEIAMECGAIVYDYEWTDDFSAARNFGLGKATGDWILVLDADEYFINDCRESIQNHIKKGNKIGRIGIRSKFESNGEVKESVAYVSRLFPKVMKFEGRIHEQLKSELPRITTSIVVLHDGYYITDKTERNISLLARELAENPNDPYFLYQIGKEYRNRKEFEKANEYFLKSYSMITRNENYTANVIIEYLNNLNKLELFAEALRIIDNEAGYLNDHPDFHFAKAVVLTNYLYSTPNPTMKDLKQIENAYLRCLEIGDTCKYESVMGVGSFLTTYNLGLLYELCGLHKKAKYYYKKSAKQNYQPAMNRLKEYI